MSLRILIFLVFLSVHNLFAQQLSPEASIRVLTIGPGSNLNDAFGHSAFHIQDHSQNIDMVFNYGVYDFDTPNFYTKFAQGKLHYLIGVNYFDDFMLMYKRQDRTVLSQELDLDSEQKQVLFDYLLENYKPENRRYLYDFFYNNCATKIRDVLQTAIGEPIVFHEPEVFQPQTFRTLIQDNLKTNSWGSMGIDLALGSVIDQTATAEEHMFLPEYIHTFFNTATLGNGNKKLVKQDKTLYTKQDINSNKSSFFISPGFILGAIGLFIVIITYFDFIKGKQSRWLDFTISALTGVIGLLLLLLWFATDHTATAQNYNLLWAFPLNIILGIQLLKKQPKLWGIKFLKFLLIMLALMAFHWTVGIQVFAPVLIPLLLALAIRYVYVIYALKKRL
ncbi:lipoprotein N-acyltransferase Lnb domain-containing protein [Hanstruepera flava]|uniref:lipoprotein N-acyltransferase Lnb domain-containing protein n=1 Tax=Hanstruepera flava TaxID=2930218 RepID=UPI00202852A4|nr:DUF4105 domain-containing protein [Hanstruepera flava]